MEAKMTRTDKMILTGAWAAMAVAGVYSYWKISESPKIDPTIERLCIDLAKLHDSGITVCGERQTKPLKPDFGPTNAGLAYIAPEADLFRTQAKGTPVD